VKEEKYGWDLIVRRLAPYEEFFSEGTRHHCPMEVGAYAFKCIPWLHPFPKTGPVTLSKTLQNNGLTVAVFHGTSPTHYNHPFLSVTEVVLSQASATVYALACLLVSIACLCNMWKGFVKTSALEAFLHASRELVLHGDISLSITNHPDWLLSKWLKGSVHSVRLLAATTKRQRGERSHSGVTGLLKLQVTLSAFIVYGQ